jgi:hypothetical protein
VCAWPQAQSPVRNSGRGRYGYSGNCEGSNMRTRTNQRWDVVEGWGYCLQQRACFQQPVLANQHAVREIAHIAEHAAIFGHRLFRRPVGMVECMGTHLRKDPGEDLPWKSGGQVVTRSRRGCIVMRNFPGLFHLGLFPCIFAPGVQAKFPQKSHGHDGLR